jgi:molecular chaperone IbpA
MSKPQHTVIGANGLGHLFQTVQHLTHNMKNKSYPPYDISVSEDSKVYLIEIALAGFKKNEILVTCGNGVLCVSGQKPEHTPVLHKVSNGISYRPFDLKWSVGSGYEVKSAEFVDGLLSIQLEHIEDQQIHKIHIN